MGARMVLSSLLLLAGGCVIVLDTPEDRDPGGETPPPSSTTDARQTFDDEVYPILVNRCAGCHSTEAQPTNALGFIVPGNRDKTYELVKATIVLTEEPAASRLLTKGIHEGPSLTQNESFAIMHWLDLERAGI